jgi:hypothetical protein
MQYETIEMYAAGGGGGSNSIMSWWGGGERVGTREGTENMRYRYEVGGGRGIRKGRRLKIDNDNCANCPYSLLRFTDTWA